MSRRVATVASLPLSCPMPIARPGIVLARPRRRRPADAPADRADRSCPPSATRRWMPRHDGAVLDGRRGRLAFTTDSYVVQPALLPRRRHRHAGGQRHGERPGHVRRAAALPQRRLHPGGGLPHGDAAHASSASMRDAARRRPACSIVTGDTKVVERGKGDGLFINTAGVGLVEHDLDDRARRRPRRATPSCSAATSAATASPSWRCGKGWSSRPLSRATAHRWRRLCSPCSPPGIEVHCLRDLTRGGLATALDRNRRVQPPARGHPRSRHRRRGKRARRVRDPGA